MTRRGLAHWGRQPVQVAVGVVFPVMTLLMFGYLIGGGRDVDGDYIDYLVPGTLALAMAFGLESTVIAVTQDLNKGVIDRFRSMPMANGAVLVGRSAADMLQSALSLAVMVGVGYAIGWRTHSTAGEFLGAVGLLLLFRFAMLWIGIHLALVAGKPELVQAVQILVWPVGFLSNAIATPESMPDWLGTVVQWNPMSRTATTARDLTGSIGGESGHVWAAVLWPLALLAVFAAAGVAHLVKPSWIRPGDTVLSVGITRTVEGIIGTSIPDAERVDAGARGCLAAAVDDALRGWTDTEVAAPATATVLPLSAATVGRSRQGGRTTGHVCERHQDGLPGSRGRFPQGLHMVGPGGNK